MQKSYFDVYNWQCYLANLFRSACLSLACLPTMLITLSANKLTLAVHKLAHPSRPLHHLVANPSATVVMLSANMPSLVLFPLADPLMSVHLPIGWHMYNAGFLVGLSNIITIFSVSQYVYCNGYFIGQQVYIPS